MPGDLGFSFVLFGEDRVDFFLQEGCLLGFVLGSELRVHKLLLKLFLGDFASGELCLRDDTTLLLGGQLAGARNVEGAADLGAGVIIDIAVVAGPLVLAARAEALAGFFLVLVPAEFGEVVFADGLEALVDAVADVVVAGHVPGVFFTFLECSTAHPGGGLVIALCRGRAAGTERGEKEDRAQRK